MPVIIGKGSRGRKRRSVHRGAELGELAGREVTAGADGQAVEPERTEADASQSQHRVSERVAVALHLVLAPFRKGEPDAASFSPRIDELHGHGLRASIVELDAAAPSLEITCPHLAGHVGFVEAWQL